jgi:hypothetical protein
MIVDNSTIITQLINDAEWRRYLNNELEGKILLIFIHSDTDYSYLVLTFIITTTITFTITVTTVITFIITITITSIAALSYSVINLEFKKFYKAQPISRWKVER